MLHFVSHVASSLPQLILLQYCNAALHACSLSFHNQKDRFFFERRRKIRIFLSYTLPTALSILYGVPGRSTVLPYRTSLVLQRKLCTYHPTTKSKKAERFVSSHNSAQKHHRQATKCVGLLKHTTLECTHNQSIHFISLVLDRAILTFFIYILFYYTFKT